MRGPFRAHPNYVMGFIVWICAISTIIMFPNLLPKLKLLKKGCVSCSGYSRFLDTLTAEQKSDFELLEAGAINVEGTYYLIGKNSNEEFDLYKKRLIEYQELEPIVDEKLRRLIIWNSLLETLSPEVHNLILNKKAIILFRDNRFIMVGPKEKLGSSK